MIYQRNILLILLFVTAWCPQIHAQLRSNWEALPLKFNKPVYTLYTDTSADELYATGFYTTVNNIPCNVVHWNGSQATLLPKSPHVSTARLANYKGKLVVSGNVGVAVFDGNYWTLVDSSHSSVVYCIEPYKDKLVLGGRFNSYAGQNVASGAIWDGGTGWSDLYRVDTLFNNDSSLSHQFSTFVEYKNQIYIGGNFDPDGKPLIKEIARFDGQNWRDVGGGMRGDGLAGVSKLMVWKDELYVAGEFLERDGSPGNCIAKWDGNQWHRLGDGVTDIYEAAIYDMAVYNDNLYVVGPFREIGGVKADGFAKWDGTKWCSMGSEFENLVSTIESYKGELYVGGAFKNIDGDTSLSRFVKWTGGDYTKECGVPMSVEPTQISSSSIYPNPATSIIRVKIKNAHSVGIYDMAGRLVKTADSNEIQTGVDISQLAIGIYTIHVISENRLTILKFTKF